MFTGCTGLTTAPVLPAATLADFCYYGMFYGCSSLNSITCLATYISASACTSSWVDGVPTGGEAGTFTCHHKGGLWDYGVNGIPSGWSYVEEYPPT